MPIAWIMEAPPQALRSDIGLIALDPGESVTCRLLGPFFWTKVHWTGTRSIVCRGDQQCGCHSDPVNDKGFAAVLSHGRDWRGKKPGYHKSVIVMTRETAACAAALRIGDLFTVSRREGKSNSPLEAFREERTSKDALPEQFDPRPFVLRAMTLPSQATCKWRKRA